jgi:hypothetical protein
MFTKPERCSLKEIAINDLKSKDTTLRDANIVSLSTTSAPPKSRQSLSLLTTEGSTHVISAEPKEHQPEADALVSAYQSRLTSLGLPVSA